MSGARWRAVYLLAGLVLIVLVGTLVLDAHFSSGLSPAPFVAADYALGAAIGLAVAAVFGTKNIAKRQWMALPAALAFVAAFAPGVSEICWFLAIPGTGALIALAPLPGASPALRANDA